MLAYFGGADVQRSSLQTIVSFEKLEIDLSWDQSVVKDSNYLVMQSLFVFIPKSKWPTHTYVPAVLSQKILCKYKLDESQGTCLKDF